MIRMSRLTDYGVVLMSYMAADPGRVHTAAEAAASAGLPLPTVSKLLRVLARGKLLVSHRGVKGGYSLACPPEEISIARIIRTLEGPVSLTACTADEPEDCEHEGCCPVRTRWQKINGAVWRALEGITLAEMAAAPSRGAAAPKASRPSLSG